MTRVSSVSDTSYAYLATLSRLDSNGDGVLSRGERAADEKPGILKQLSENEDVHPATPKFSGSVLAYMMESGGNGASGSDLQDGNSDEAYRNTYGQYDLDIAS
jgi:hypothetical protein